MFDFDPEIVKELSWEATEEYVAFSIHTNINSILQQLVTQIRVWYYCPDIVMASILMKTL